MGIQLKDFIKDPSNVFTEEEAIMIYKQAGYVEIVEKEDAENQPTNEKE